MIHFKGTFNWHGEVFSLSTKAKNETIAYTKLTQVIAKKVGRTVSCVKAHFDGTRDNFTIREVREDGSKE